jgi:hypothetical protein
MTGRRAIYGDLGRERRQHEPPSVSTVTQHVLRGTLGTQVQADVAYTHPGEIRFHIGPVYVVLQGKEAALSMRELIDKLGHIIDELYPDLDAEMARQHRERLREAAAEQATRARINGTEPAASVVRRRAGGDVTT